MLQKIIPVISDLDTNYTANDVLGVPSGTTGYFTLTNLVERQSRFVILQSVVLTDKDSQSPSVTIHFFDQAPTNSTFTDNSALAIHATDWTYHCGAVVLDTGDFITANGNNDVLTQKSIGLELPHTDNGDIYCVFQIMGGGLDFASADALIYKMCFVPSA
mgnify:CR=1 FL=1